ncbi:S-adenosyl-L-methionine-dependent methyltransferase [Sporodiniella umbellata]|nr:S-adenosyl-L-methionine-dependent methyltransferase [Sporodiniella umbellata]
MSQSRWIQKLLKVCDGDLAHAKKQLQWLREKVLMDSRGKIERGWTLTTLEKQRLDEWVDQRVIQHKPLQYILGTQPFCELDIVTRPPTLIPRWETEEWTDRLIELLKRYVGPGKMRILDACTGTGCIALALSSGLPKDSVEITGIDLSRRAIELSEHNRALHASRLRNPVRFEQRDLMDSCASYPFDLIVSNPPYVTHEEYKELTPDVKQWEDKRALVADDQGTRIHRQLIEIASHCQPFHRQIPRTVFWIFRYGRILQERTG